MVSIRNGRLAPVRCACGKSRVAKLDWIDAAGALRHLRSPPANQLEALKADRRGQHRLRINDQYRICFVWTNSGSDQVEIVDYHS